MKPLSQPAESVIRHSRWSHPLVFYQSERLSAYAERLIHGFSGKPVTFGGPGFQQEDLLADRRALCEALGLDGEKLVVPSQTHSANIRHNRDNTFEDTDAVLLLEPGVPVMLMFADCTPVLIYDPRQHIGAVIHAGWRGTAQAIAGKMARVLINSHGSRPEDLIGVVGPAIGGCCYEVSQEVVDGVSQTVNASQSIYITRNAQGKPQMDLQTVNRLQLEETGVGQVEVLSVCTRCETNALWSHRRGESGRQTALMALLHYP